MQRKSGIALVATTLLLSSSALTPAAALGPAFWQGIMNEAERIVSEAEDALRATFQPGIDALTQAFSEENLNDHIVEPVTEAFQPVVEVFNDGGDALGDLLEPVTTLVDETIPEFFEEGGAFEEVIVEPTQEFFEETLVEAFAEDNIVGELTDVFAPVIEFVNETVPDAADQVVHFFDNDLRDFVNGTLEDALANGEIGAESLAQFLDDIMLNEETEEFVENAVPLIVNGVTGEAENEELAEELANVFGDIEGQVNNGEVPATSSQK
ncbi:hypothetical protein HOP50_07g49590 [Chloropicon primus]|uniref:Uncharacterized protein n=1 Tax=Chloropicon primus TaxID=1764295 RepID=A0A5B8MPI3_9CHLO|nr:hypothetical protein A3770_07p49370 [Chloropicon primus]UPR01637.1 hypothetical protein HOP50_07g49590 [Chloropicon primus]|mmetsp:Transcript_3886/g.11235  ORF Transcript_3886/g.11235 Transcript_3886/m.11235 type:complete len:267 (-) Transcript_3886:3264-4064(-)|eukprot:QDZ22419.1 hypothetical protein A3770_07p49370 [Chloropicon primus]